MIKSTQIRGRQDYAGFEDQYLASFATRSSETQGRKIDEKECDFRTPFQRDIGRIIHSFAFRRLQYKTQVFVNHEGDFYRTRLTHVLAVSQIGKTIARALGANEDLVEAIALAHDIGHPPFGHAGEEALNEEMKDLGGFEHNVNSLRVVDVLERRVPNYSGLNLSYEVREGIVCHKTDYDNPAIHAEFDNSPQPSIESQIVSISDPIAYRSHDLDDGLAIGILNIRQLDESDLDLWERCSSGYKRTANGRHALRLLAVRNLIDVMIRDVLAETTKRLEQHNIHTAMDVRQQNEPMVAFSNEVKEADKALGEYLYQNIYRNKNVMRMTVKGKRIIKQLFGVMLEEPNVLDEPYRSRCESEPDRHQAVCDYISGMTDRFAMDLYNILFDPYERAGFHPGSQV